MKGKDKLVRIYSGNEVSVNMLKGRLDIIGISSAIQNNSHDHFLQGVPAAVDLYISGSDIEKAGPVVKEFIRNNMT